MRVGMLRVVFNREAGNYYSKSTFVMTVIKQEKLVFILVILYIRKYLCVYKIVYGYPGIKRFPLFGYPVPEITENTHPYSQRLSNKLVL